MRYRLALAVIGASLPVAGFGQTSGQPFPEVKSEPVRSSSDGSSLDQPPVPAPKKWAPIGEVQSPSMTGPLSTKVERPPSKMPAVSALDGGWTLSANRHVCKLEQPENGIEIYQMDRKKPAFQAHIEAKELEVNAGEALRALLEVKAGDKAVPVSANILRVVSDPSLYSALFEVSEPDLERIMSQDRLVIVQQSSQVILRDRPITHSKQAYQALKKCSVTILAEQDAYRAKVAARKAEIDALVANPPPNSVARPIDYDDWIKPDDYPPNAIIEGQEGIVSVALSVTEAGRVSGCEVVQSSGYEELDIQSCQNMMRNARFVPRTDPDGKRVASKVRIPVRWSVPD